MKLKSCKNRQRENEFEFKEQENVKDFIEQEKQDEMMKESLERMKKI
jgi:hypothetical protein